jgi:hypothetical protein
MIRSRAKRHRRTQRGTLRSAAHDRCDEPLRVVVRMLARQAARQWFERDVAAQRATPHEVTVQ